MSKSLTEFLLARIAEDERMWKLAETAELAFTTRSEGVAAVPPVNFARRMVADCKAKRRIVEDATNQHTSGPELDWVVQVLATVYADHPAYREEWRS